MKALQNLAKTQDLLALVSLKDLTLFVKALQNLAKTQDLLAFVSLKDLTLFVKAFTNTHPPTLMKTCPNFQRKCASTAAEEDFFHFIR